MQDDSESSIWLGITATKTQMEVGSMGIMLTKMYDRNTET